MKYNGWVWYLRGRGNFRYLCRSTWERTLEIFRHLPVVVNWEAKSNSYRSTRMSTDNGSTAVNKTFDIASKPGWWQKIRVLHSAGTPQLRPSHHLPCTVDCCRELGLASKCMRCIIALLACIPYWSNGASSQVPCMEDLMTIMRGWVNGNFCKLE